MAANDLLIRTLIELADTLVEDFDVVEMLTLLTDRCLESFDVQDAGIVLASPMGAELRLVASSSDTMRDLELYELQTSDGPCIDSYENQTSVFNVVLEDARDRWPRFAPAAIDAGFASVSALPLNYRRVTLGALNLFRAESEPMPDAELSAARAFADMATIAILQHRAVVNAQQVNAQLNHALNNRILIEQAKGMLAERAGIGIDAAFSRLRNYARRRQVRLAEVAQGFLDGEISHDVLAAAES